MLPDTPPPEQALMALGLSAEVLGILAEQGFVKGEYRPGHGRRRGPYFRLHWRRAGRPQSHYLGSDATQAEAVAAALFAWQRPRRLALQTARDMAKVPRMLRALKQSLTPLLAAGGSHFHGDSLRRSRRETLLGTEPSAPE